MAQVRTFSPDELAEIRDSYRLAANPAKQVGILADLYACAPQDIQQALGLPVTSHDAKPAASRRKKQTCGSRVRWQPEQVARLCELYESGYKLVDIADMLGVPLERVKKKVFNMGAAGQLTLRSHQKPQKVVPTPKAAPEQPPQQVQQEEQAIAASSDEPRSDDADALLRDSFSRLEKLPTGEQCSFLSVPQALSELERLLARAAALTHALRVLAERGGGDA